MAVPKKKKSKEKRNKIFFTTFFNLGRSNLGKKSKLWVKINNLFKY